MKNIFFGIIKKSGMPAVLLGIYLLFFSADVHAQSFIRKKHRIGVAVEGSGIGIGPHISFNMTPAISWGLAYYSATGEGGDLKKEGSSSFLHFRYIPFERTNLYFGLGIGNNTYLWKGQYCTDYVAGSGCQNVDIDWPINIYQGSVGFMNINTRSRFVALFQLQYTTMGDPEYKADTAAIESAIKTRYKTEVDAFKTQIGIMIGLGLMI